MKRVLFLLILMSSCYSVERSCVDFKTGVFEFSTSNNDSIITSNFIRTDNYEIETFNGVKDSSIIKWVNECEFLLTKIRPKTNQEKRPIRIKILRTYGDQYDFEFSGVNNPDKISRGTVKRVSN